MGPRRCGRALALVLAALLSGVVVLPADAAPFPSVKLLASSDHVEIQRFEGDPVFFELGVYVASVGGPFELRVRHHPYDEPFRIKQVVPGSTEARHLPSNILDGWNGLVDFMTVTVTDEQQQTVSEEPTNFCPSGYQRQRVNDSGPTEPVYSEYCGGHPFARGMVWGIERGWAVSPFGFDGPFADVPDGEYDITVSIAEKYRKLFAIPGRHASVTVHATVTTVPFEGPEPPFENSDVSASDAGAPRASTAVPTMLDPDPSLLPDLRSLPAYYFATSHATETATDYLDFAAHEWNGGPQPMVIEGFRRPGEDVMDAYQYFYRDGRPVGRAKVGKMEYHAGGGHDHWHLLQFTSYNLLDMNKNLVVDAGKQSWCLVPTDPIDLTVPNAVWRPGEDGPGSSCGGNSSIWIRESVPVGWGDTYYQVAGQAFDITNVPNGDYFVRIKVNPLGKLYEVSRTNDASLRKVTLGGVPGARTVTSDPYKGIDTEGGFYP